MRIGIAGYGQMGALIRQTALARGHLVPTVIDPQSNAELIQGYLPLYQRLWQRTRHGQHPDRDDLCDDRFYESLGCHGGCCQVTPRTSSVRPDLSRDRIRS